MDDKKKKQLTPRIWTLFSVGGLLLILVVVFIAIASANRGANKLDSDTTKKSLSEAATDLYIELVADGFDSVYIVDDIAVQEEIVVDLDYDFSMLTAESAADGDDDSIEEWSRWVDEAEQIYDKSIRFLDSSEYPELSVCVEIINSRDYSESLLKVKRGVVVYDYVQDGGSSQREGHDKESDYNSYNYDYNNYDYDYDDYVDSNYDSDIGETTKDDNNLSSDKISALQKAKDYLAYSAFSKSGLIDQLQYEGFSEEDAKYAVDNCGADWDEQAKQKAIDYLHSTPFSKSGLADQLEYEGFSKEEAENAVDNCGADWNEQAVKKAQDYRNSYTFSHAELVDQLEYEGFTAEQAEYGASATE